MINDDELNKILENTNLDEFELPVIGSPREKLDVCCRRAWPLDQLPLPIQIVCRGWQPVTEVHVLWNCARESTLPGVFSVFPLLNINKHLSLINACL